jgi:HK97 family phage major capsid protein
MLQQRDMTATGGASTGGNFIMTEVIPSLIPLLRNKTVCGRMGARLMGGLVNNINIPRQTGAATATWNAEIAPLTESDQATDHVILSPNRLGGWTSFSKQLLQQSVLDVQSFVREDLLAIVYLAQDKAGLAGTGPNQPVGVLNTVADTVWPSAYSKTSPSVTFGSGYPSWSKIVSFKGNV